MVITKSCLFVSGRTQESHPSFERVLRVNPDCGSSVIFATARRGPDRFGQEQIPISVRRHRPAASHLV